MKRGCFLLMAAAVFATARVEAVDPITDFTGFDGNFEIIDFNLLTPDDPIGDIATTTNTVSFNNNLFASSGGIAGAAINIDPAGPTVISPIVIDFASPVDIVVFTAFTDTATSIDITFQPANQTLNFALPGVAIFGGRDVDNGITGISIAVIGGSQTLVVDDFTIEDLLPEISVVPVDPTAALGPTPTGTPVTQDITISNGAAALAPLDLQTVVLTGDTEFTLTTDPSPAVVQPGNSVVATITYLPLDAGPHNTTVTITSDDSTSPNTVSFSGTGIPPEISVTNVNFGIVRVGDTALDVIAISNAAGGGPLTVTSIVFDPTTTNDTEFGIVLPTDFPTTPLVIAAGSTENVQVTYSPTALVTNNATVEIISDDPGMPSETSALTGEGGLPDISASDVDFSDVDIGVVSNLSLTITNDGNFNLTVSAGGITLANDADNQFAVDTSGLVFPLVIPPGGGTAVVPVSFTPVVQGLRMATVSIASDDLGSPTPATLMGTGIGATMVVTSTNPITGNDASIDFGTPFVGDVVNEMLIVTNTGNGDLFFTPTLNGEAPETAEGPYALTDFLTGLPIATPILVDKNGGQVRLNVNYSPVEVQVDDEQIELDHNDFGQANPLDVPLAGEGLPVLVPEIFVSPTSILIGGVLIGSGSVHSFRIGNEGAGVLVISSIEIAGSAEYRVSGGPSKFPHLLDPNDTLKMTLVFEPRQVGRRSATLVITSNDLDESVLNVALSGTGVFDERPNIAVSPATLDFGSVPGGEQSTLPVTITNNGTRLLIVSNVEVAEGAAFSLGDLELPLDLAANVSVDIDVTFTPSEVGDADGTLVIESNDEDQPVVNVSIVGTGTATPVPEITFDGTDSALDFGQVQAASTVTKIITLRNSGFAELIVEITLAEGSSDEFVYNGPLNASLIPNETRDLEVTFAPQDAGSETGTLVFVSNDPDPNDATIEISLFGTGTVDPVAQIDVDTAPALPFGQVQIESPMTKTFHINNVGTAPLRVISISLGENTSGDFTISDSPMLPLDIAPGAHSDVSVDYDPSDLGFDSGTVVVESLDDGNPSILVSLTGVGVEKPVPVIEVTPDTVDLGDVLVNESNTASFTIRSVGSANLNVTAIGFGEAGGGDFTLGVVVLPVSLAADGGEMTVDVTFTPSAPGAASTMVVIESDDPADLAVVVTLNGTGVALPSPQVGVDPDALDFGDTEIGVVAALELTVSNGGDLDLVLDSVGIGAGSSSAFKVTGAPDEIILAFAVTIDEAQVRPPEMECIGTGSTATGTGTLQLDLSTGEVTYEITYGQLVGIETAAHVHGAADRCVNAAVVFGLVSDPPNTSPKAGSAILTPEQQEDMIAGLFYVNIHSTEHPGGEIRGQIELVPVEPVAVLAPGDSAVFEVTYSPEGEPGSDSGTVEITSNDPENGVLVVSLAGNGVVGAVMQIQIAPPSVDFGGTLVGTTASADVTIRNLGTADLDLSGIELGIGSSQMFNITSGPGDMTVEPGTEATVTVSYTPLVAMADSGTLRVASNDQRRPEVSVSLFGFGSGETSAPVFKRGDANSDSTVDISDVVKTLMFLFGGGSELDCHDAADSNDDGSLDVSDGLFTVTRLFGGSALESLPAVADTCTVDGRNDDLPDCNYPLDSCGI